MASAYTSEYTKEYSSGSLMPAVIIGGAALLLAPRLGMGRLVQIGLLGGAAYLLVTRAKPMLQAAREPIQVRKTVSIMKPAQEIYQFWRKLENLPQFMKHLEAVTQLDQRRSHWIARAPIGMSVDWEATITEDIPGERIAWRSVEGSQIPNQGSVSFRDLGPERGTVVLVELEYHPPAGAVGAGIAKLFGEEPKQQIDSDLKRLRAILEAGQTPTIQGQPVGKGQPRSSEGRKMTQGY